MTISLEEALNRIRLSHSANEGPDARCELPAFASPPLSLQDVLHHIPGYAQVNLRRTVRNWTIEDPHGVVLVRSHPWDDTPNVAKLGTRPDPAHIESLVQFSSRVQELANEAERLRQFVIAQNLWQMVSVINDYTGQPVENAIREARRLTEVVAALVPTPKRGAT